MDSLLETALAYLDMGVPVIPIDAGTKVPRVKWKEYQTRLPTRAEAFSWPWDAMAMLTGVGSGYVVVDCDTREAGAFWSRFRTRTPMVAQTKRGYHFYYQMVRPIRSDVGVHLAPGLSYDIKGVASYVLVAPSPGYRWLYGIFPASELPAFNASWRPEKQYPEKTYNVQVKGGVYWEADKASRRIMDSALKEAPNGRNQAGFRAALQLRDNGVPREHAEFLLTQFARAVACLRDGNYSEREARDTVRNAYSRPPRRPWRDTVHQAIQRDLPS
jgi:hypothetical protein